MGVYFVQTLHLLGAGFLTQQIVSVVGGADKGTWLTLPLTFTPVLLGPPVSQSADFWGRKWFVVGFTYFGTVGCIVVSRSNSIGMAIAGQVVAALAHSCQALLHAITSEVIPRRYRPLAQSCNNVASGTGALIGLFAGGALCRHNPAGFRDYFYMLAALYAVAATIIIFVYNPPKRQEQRLRNSQKLHSLDLPGWIMLIVALLTFCVGLGWSENPYDWKNAHVLAPFLVGVVSTIGLACYVKFFKEHGLIDHDLFRESRNFAVAEICIFAEGVSLLAANNYFGFQVTILYRKDLWQTSLTYTITWYSYIVFAILTGFYCSRTKSIRTPVMVAFSSFTLFFILMATTNLHSSKAVWGYCIFLGLGLGVALNALVVVAQLSTPKHLISTTTGLLIATRALGAAVGLTIFDAVFNSTLKTNLVPKITEAALATGLPKSSLNQFIVALTTGDVAKIEATTGISPSILEASTLALKEAYNIGFRNVYISGGCFSFFALFSKSLPLELCVPINFFQWRRS